MSETKKSLGAAIDGIVSALSGLDEKDHLVAISAACAHLSLPLPSLEKPVATAPVSTQAHAPVDQIGSAVPSIPKQQITDIRSLKEEKKPSSDREMACLVAYYLQYVVAGEEKKEAIEAADIKTFFAQANYPVPTAWRQTLINAKAAGYFDSAGRGGFKLNPVGYNLVVHGLPRTENGSSNNGYKPRVRKKVASKKAKKGRGGSK